jgi:hypothetical protein
MPVEEFMLWRAYDRVSPIGDMRHDVLASIMAAAPLQAAGAKVTALDMLPPWSRIKRDDPEQPEEDEAEPAETFFAFLRGRAASAEPA